MSIIIDKFLQILTIVLDSAASWFFCCVISIFILPLIVDRIVFYIPRLIKLSISGEVYAKSIIFTILEVILWSGIIFGLYYYLFRFQNHLFALATTHWPALIAWQICIIYLIYRFVNFDRKIKKEFYYGAYMRYIKAEAYSEYLNFIEDIDNIDIEELKTLVNKPMSYMHKQAVLRKIKEAKMK